jgi:hypothetical protein
MLNVQTVEPQSASRRRHLKNFWWRAAEIYWDFLQESAVVSEVRTYESL